MRLHWRFMIICVAISTAGLLSVDFLLSNAAEQFYLEQVSRTLKREINTSRAFLEQNTTYNSPNLHTLTQTLGQNLELRVTLIDSSGVVLADSEVPQNDLPSLDNHANRAEIISARQTGFGQSMRYSATLQQQMLYVAIPAFINNQHPITIRLAIGLKEIENLQNNIHTTIIEVSLIGIILSLILSYVGSKVITRPVHNLIDTANQIREGDFSTQPILQYHSIPEINQLATAIDFMRTQIQNRIHLILLEQSRQQTILSTTPDGLLLTDQNGNIELVNPAFEKLIIEPSLTGKRSPLHLNRYPQLNEAIQNTLQTHQEQQFEITKAPNQTLYIQIAPVINQNVCMGTVTICRDITEIQLAKQERERFITELENKNAELEQFAYTVSHDLKSPLVTIKNFLPYLKREVKSENALKDIDFISSAADQMGNMLDDLLELSRIGHVINKPEDINLNELIDNVVQLISGKIQTQNITISIAPNLPTILADPARIREIFQNLIENAAKFMGDQPHPHIEIGTYTQGTEPVFFVRDNGIGIDPKHQAQIFGLFDRLNPQVEGTGIGLTHVKRIIEHHNGRIWVASKGNNTGTTFHFTIPNSATSN